MFSIKRFTLLLATVLQLSAAMCSFLIILILKNKLTLEVFAELSIAFFLSGIVIPLTSMKLGRKYFILVRDMGLSPFVWMTQRFVFFSIVTSLVYIVSYKGGVAPTSVALVFFIFLSSIDLVPKGYFEAHQAITNAVLQFIERFIQFIMCLIDPDLFFRFCIPVRMTMIFSLWAAAFWQNRGREWQSLTMAHYRRFLREVRLYAPSGIVNTIMLQAPIWLGGVHTDVQAISNLAIIRQATLFSRNFSVVASNIFHVAILSVWSKFLTFFSGMIIVTTFGLVALLIVLENVVGAGTTTIMIFLIVLWSFQITFVNLLSKRMSLKEVDTNQLAGAIVGLFVVMVVFFLLRIMFNFVESYVISIVIAHTVSIILAYWLAARNVNIKI